jgi:hypothetical protein
LEDEKEYRKGYTGNYGRKTTQKPGQTDNRTQEKERVYKL